MMHLVGAYAGIFCWGCSRNIYYYESDSITLYSTKNAAGGPGGALKRPLVGSGAKPQKNLRFCIFCDIR